MLSKLKPIMIVNLMWLPMQAFAQGLPESTLTSTPSTPSTPASISASVSQSAASSHALMFQIIQDEFVLDNSTVKNAHIIESENGHYQGLNVELKSEAAKVFTDMTQAGLGRRMNIVFNNVVISSATIQSALGDHFLISGISRQDAQAFLNILIANKPKSEQAPL